MEALIQHQIPVGVQLDGVVPCCTTGTEICPAFHSLLTKYLAFPPKKKKKIKSQVENCMKKFVLFIYYKTFSFR